MKEVIKIKGLILAAGKGERMGDIKTPKCLLKVNAKPLIQYNLDELADIDEINEVIIVLGYDDYKTYERFPDKYKDMKIKYVIQPTVIGIVDAIDKAKDALDKEDFCLLLGDEILIDSKLDGMIQKFKHMNLFSVVGINLTTELEDIKDTYSIQVDGFKVTDLEEKPITVTNFFQGTGHCVFKYDIVNYIKDVPINKERNQKELVDLIQTAINDGKEIEWYAVCDGYYNINTQDDLLEAKKELE